MGAQVKKTANIRNDLRPQASDSAPSRGAERNDRIPCKKKYFHHAHKFHVPKQPRLVNSQGRVWGLWTNQEGLARETSEPNVKLYCT